LNTGFISVFSGFIFIWHICEQREWACPAMQSMKKTKSSRVCLGSRNFSETDFILAEKTRLDREKIPGLCTVV
jgi:hypothetical protein